MSIQGIVILVVIGFPLVVAIVSFFKQKKEKNTQQT